MLSSTVIITLIAALVMLAAAGVAKAAIDVLTHQAGNNIFERLGPWWDARTSWKRKYKDYDAGDLRPRFPGAKSWLVMLTDFWHAADTVYLTSYALGFMLLTATLFLGLGTERAGIWCLPALALARVYVSGLFELFYTRIFRINKPSA